MTDHTRIRAVAPLQILLLIVIVPLAGCLNDGANADPPNGSEPDDPGPDDPPEQNAESGFWDLGAGEDRSVDFVEDPLVKETGFGVRSIWSTSNRSGAVLFEVDGKPEVSYGQCLSSLFVTAAFLNGSRVVDEVTGGRIYVRMLDLGDSRAGYRTATDFPGDYTVMLSEGRPFHNAQLRPTNALYGQDSPNGDCTEVWLVVAYELPPEATSLAFATKWLKSHDGVVFNFEEMRDMLKASNATRLDTRLHSSKIHFEHCTSEIIYAVRDKGSTPGCQVTMKPLAQEVYEEFSLDVDIQVDDISGWTETYMNVPYGGAVGEWEIHYHHGSKQRDGARYQPNEYPPLLTSGSVPSLHSVDVHATGPLCIKIRVDQQLERGNGDGRPVQYALFSVATGLDLQTLGREIDGVYTAFQGVAENVRTPDYQLECA